VRFVGVVACRTGDREVAGSWLPAGTLPGNSSGQAVHSSHICGSVHQV